jgi:hypothetical protein
MSDARKGTGQELIRAVVSDDDGFIFEKIFSFTLIHKLDRIIVYCL